MDAPLKPIRTEADHEAALTEVARLWGAKGDTPEAHRLDVLATLIEAYEDEHFPVDPPDPIDAILFRLDQQDLTPEALEPMIGSRTAVAEVLARERGLSIEMIRKLHASLGIPAEILIRPTVEEAA